MIFASNAIRSALPGCGGQVKRGRIARWGGVEAPPKTGEREVPEPYPVNRPGSCDRNGTWRTSMSSISIDEAQAKLSDLIHDLRPGDKILITEGKEPVALLLPAASEKLRTKRQLGTLRGTVTFIAPDFDAPLEDFKEYME